MISVKSVLNNFKLNENTDNAFKIEDYWDINSFSKEQLQSINTDLSIFVYGNNFGEPMQIDNGKLKVYESSTKEFTLPYKEVKEELKKVFHFYNWQIVEENKANNIILILLYSDIGNNNEIIIEKMKLMGWSKLHKTQLGIYKGIPCSAISFVPIYQVSIKNIFADEIVENVIVSNNNNPILNIADENIVCYKAFCVYDGKLHGNTSMNDFNFCLSTLYKTNLMTVYKMQCSNKESDIRSCFKLYKEHPFIMDRVVCTTINGHMVWFEVAGLNTIICQCIIPKGSHYYTNEYGMIATDQFIIIKECSDTLVSHSLNILY